MARRSVHARVHRHRHARRPSSASAAGRSSPPTLCRCPHPAPQQAASGRGKRKHARRTSAARWRRSGCTQRQYRWHRLYESCVLIPSRIICSYWRSATITRDLPHAGPDTHRTRRHRTCGPSIRQRAARRPAATADESGAACSMQPPRATRPRAGRHWVVLGIQSREPALP